MPLVKGKGKKAISENIRIEKHAHPDMPIKQAAAIAYSQARKSGAKIPKKGKRHAKKDS
jgi:hypothetical protein